MIACELQGRLGNMMFQIAAIENMGYMAGIETIYPYVDKNIDDLAKPQACTSEPIGREYFTLFPNFDWHKNHDKEIKIKNTVHVPFEYVPINPTDNTCYVGYFQSEKYFPNRELILKLFEPANFIKERMSKYADIIGNDKAAIHIRRGDYIKLKHVYNILDMSYYKRAIDILNQRGIEAFVIFSNDMEWCRGNFKGDQFTFVTEDKYTDMFLMASCSHNIIANSAYGWWGAWLNANPNKYVIAPRSWFMGNSLNSKDIIPDTWIKI